MRRDPYRPCRAAAFAVAVPAIVLLSLSGAAASGERSLERGGQSKPEQVFATVCGRCHPIERITAMRRSRRQWEEMIDSMITTRGAQVSDEEFETILNYLAKEFGRVDINRAPKEEIVEVLNIADAMGAAIVGYRKEHGPFENFEALLKVPSIDREALEKRRDAITF